MATAEPLAPGSTIGILGGGQLGRMLALAAAPLGLKCHIFCPDPDSPAFDVTAEITVAPYDDLDALSAFGREVDVVTYEFENVDVAAARALANVVDVRPGPNALEVSQDRLREKTFLRELGIAVADFAVIDRSEDIANALQALGGSGVLKSRRFGYDGKGQTVLSTGDDAGAAFASIGSVPAVLESFVEFSREVSIIAVRALDGRIAAYDMAENVHRDGILRTSSVPASVAPSTMSQAVVIAQKMLEALDYVGVIGIEFFVIGSGKNERLMVNEFAPRVHNSGHWTQDACAVSQFENHIRAVAGWPLGPTRRHSGVTMTNLIGDDVEAWGTLADDSGARLHLYGKSETRAGRKMGHVNRVRGAASDFTIEPRET